MTPELLAARMRRMAAKAVVSDHARQRAKERLGIPHRSARRSARLAIKKGQPFMIDSDPKVIAWQLGDAVWLFAVQQYGEQLPQAVTCLHRKHQSDGHDFRPIEVPA